VTIARLFGVLFLVNLCTIGGGYVMLPLLHRFFVEDFGWLTAQEFVDAIAIGQVTPGPLTVMNAFIGHKVAGFPGAVAATVGSYLPSILVVSLVARAYARLRDSRTVAAAFRGIQVAVVGMLLAVGADLAGVSLRSALGIGIGAASFALMAFSRVDPTFVIVGAALLGGALL
jgi:chromate transporter